MLLILIKRNRIGYLNRHLPDLNFDSELLQRVHRLPVKRRHTLRLERHERSRSIAALGHEIVIDEVKLHLEKSSPRKASQSSLIHEPKRKAARSTSD